MQWKNAIFMAEYTSGSYSMRCYYSTGDGKYLDCMTAVGSTRVQIIKLFKQINQEVQKVRKKLVGDNLWYSLTIRIDSDGKFKAEYDYNAHEENAIGYIETWKSNNL